MKGLKTPYFFWSFGNTIVATTPPTTGITAEIIYYFYKNINIILPRSAMSPDVYPNGATRYDITTPNPFHVPLKNVNDKNIAIWIYKYKKNHRKVK